MKAEIFMVKAANREEGIRKLLVRFDLMEFMGKKVALKANYNSADPFSASTHLDTLRTLVNCLKEAEKNTQSPVIVRRKPKSQVFRWQRLGSF